ncbi:alpha/beta fold hydrolase [Rhodohalobacter sp. SW132]|nr:alpha/beta fold hydrolase [Rhodohalobacter sp. SW132]
MPEFDSAPWCMNGHMHTIFASLLFQPAFVDFKRHLVPTPDGDHLNLDLVEHENGSPVTIILHGLEGSSNRFYVRNLANHLHVNGHTVAALNFRSCGGKMNKKRRFYHSGEYEDLNTVTNWLREKYPESPILAAGFSLGGSVLLNYLRHHATNNQISGFAAVSVPYDLYRGSLNLQKGFNRLYDYQFLRTLKQKLHQKRESFSDLPTFSGRTVFDFDDQVTAPIHGFEDARDYYQQCSSAYFMDEIKTWGLLIHSREDPLCPFDFTPEDVINQNPKLTTSFPERGGHVGFWSLPPGWVELTIGTYFRQLLS